jgi:nuclear transport factor 2 (NTF2) superfamily protein
VPPFTRETAAQKVRLAEDAWNTRDPQRVALAYTPDTIWRNRAEFPQGRAQVQAFLERKWARELDYRLATCSGALPASTTNPSPRRTASSIGRRAAGPTTTRA